MVSWLSTKRYGPIGVDLGSRSVKLLQFNADYSEVIDSVRWDLPQDVGKEPAQQDEAFVEGLCQARQGRDFRGRDAVLCLGAQQLYVQNIRVPRANGDELERYVRSEAEGKLPFAAQEAEIRFLEAADVRQGDTSKREVVMLACHQPVLHRLLNVTTAAGLRPVAVDVEPCAVLRCYSLQFRRDEDKTQRIMFVHVGSTNTSVVIAQGSDALFVKYIDVSGRQFDEAVARHLKMSLPEATALRRHNGDRRSDQQDPEVVRSLQEASRPVLDRLLGELAMCIRYHSVTFRGQRLARVIVGGGESTPSLVDALTERLDVKCELGDPFRTCDAAGVTGRRTQWDVAAGLALRDLNERADKS